MSIEFLSELEDKIEILIEALAKSREEVVNLNTHCEQVNSKIKKLEDENQNLREQLEKIREDADGQRDKINCAAERIQGLISRLETVQ